MIEDGEKNVDEDPKDMTYRYVVQERINGIWYNLASFRDRKDAEFCVLSNNHNRVITRLIDKEELKEKSDGTSL